METGGARARVSTNICHVGLALAEGDPSRPLPRLQLFLAYLSTVPFHQHERPKSFDIRPQRCSTVVAIPR